MNGSQRSSHQSTLQAPRRRGVAAAAQAAPSQTPQAAPPPQAAAYFRGSNAGTRRVLVLILVCRLEPYDWQERSTVLRVNQPPCQARMNQPSTPFRVPCVFALLRARPARRKRAATVAVDSCPTAAQKGRDERRISRAHTRTVGRTATFVAVSTNAFNRVTCEIFSCLESQLLGLSSTHAPSSNSQHRPHHRDSDGAAVRDVLTQSRRLRVEGSWPSWVRVVRLVRGIFCLHSLNFVQDFI